MDAFQGDAFQQDAFQVEGGQALMQNRAGIARAGATRSNFYAPNPVILIGGVDQTSAVDIYSLSLTLGKNDQPSTASFTLLPDTGLTPAIDDEIIISLGSATNRIFGGQILRLTTEYKRGVSSPWIGIEADDYGRHLDRQIVTAYYKNESATDIALDLVARFSSGFTTEAIAPNLPVIPEISFINETLRGALMRLANLILGGCLLPDPYQVIHLWGQTGDVSDRAGTPPDALSAATTSLKEFSYAPDGSQLRTRLIVEGRQTSCPIGTPEGDFEVTIGADAPVDYLIVGGGAGGSGSTAGGGGGGHVLTGTDQMVSGTFAVVVGNGGAAAGNGSTSSWNSHSVLGGTAGSGYNGGSSNYGGGSSFDEGPFHAGGGGGGAAQNGSNGYKVGIAQYYGGKGGDGAYSAISGSGGYYGGGGGGNAQDGSGNGGVGGGGRGGAGGNPAVNGTDYLGGGGGGGQTTTGGKGVVYLSYVTDALSATGGTITTAGGKTIHRFTTNGDFVVSDVVLTAPPTPIADIPLEDAGLLDPGPGTVRIGPRILDYTTVGGAIVTPGTNPPATMITKGASEAARNDIDPTATSIPVDDRTIFTETTGWVDINGQAIRYSSITPGSGNAGTLGGIPAIGFGSITAKLSEGSTVTWLGMLTFTTPQVFVPHLQRGESVIQRITVDNLDAQAIYGVQERVVNGGDLDVDGLRAKASADLGLFGVPNPTATWETDDLNAAPGRPQAFAMTDFGGTLTIDAVNLEFLPDDYSHATTLAEVLAMTRPRRACQASNVRQASIFDAVVTGA